MQTLLEFAPLIAFLVAYQQAGIYVATATLMIAMVALLALDLARTRRISPMHGISTALVMLFGGATLLLHDERFIIWKPTVFFWALGVAFLVSGLIGQRSLAERLMTAATPDAFIGVPAGAWARINLAWVAFYAAMGAANLWVAFNFTQPLWVKFKVFGITILTLAFVIAQSIYLARYQSPTESDPT